MHDFSENIIKAAAQASGLAPDRIINLAKKDNLTLARPRLELQFLPETYTRTGRTLAFTRACEKPFGPTSCGALKEASPENGVSGSLRCAAGAVPGAMKLWRKRELYEVQQSVAANVLAEDKNWLASFCYDFVVNLPSGANDARGNWVKIRADKATFSKAPDKRVGDEVIEVFSKVNQLFDLTFTWRVTSGEAQALIPTFTINVNMGKY